MSKKIEWAFGIVIAAAFGYAVWYCGWVIYVMYQVLSHVR